METEKRKAIMKTFLKSIAGLSDEEYQQRVWIEGRGPECEDYDEFYNDFFVFGVSVIQDYKDLGITDSQHQLLKKLEEELDNFDSELVKADSKLDYNPHSFLKSPEWKKIMGMAKEVLIAFDYKHKPKSPDNPNALS